MSVNNALNTTLYSTLAGGTALTALVGTRIYYAQAPDHAALPYVVYSHQAGGPLNIQLSDMRDQIVYVRGYSTNPAQAGTIDAYCSALLHRKTLSVTGWNNFWTARETDINLVETQQDGVQVHTAGALYRIRLSGA